MTEEFETNPLFSFSTFVLRIEGLAVVISCIALTWFELTINPLPFPIIFLTSAGILCGAMMVHISLYQQITKAEFYDDSFQVWGKKHKLEKHSYSEIKDVSIVKGLWYSAFLTILLEAGDNNDTEESLTITRNPMSEELDMDLYSWLKEKIGRSAEDDALSET